MSEITIKNIKYTNVPNKKVGAKVANKLTQSNIGMSQTVAAYLASENFYTLINAIDIDWNGIEIDANTHINDTSDLITWIATKAGQAGANGVTPHIGQNGNWFIGDTDTNVKAEGTKGDKGDDGTPGTNGKSAYELYVDSVPSGETAMTQAEWLASLKGAKGDTGTVDTTNFYTKAEVDQKVANAASGGNVDLSGYAQKSELATVATTGDYDDLTNKPTIPTVPTKTSDLTNDSGFLTSHQSLSNYYTKDQVDSFNFITEYGLSQLVYGKDESDAKYLTSHQSLANYYTKNDIDGFMFVTGADLSQNVYTKDEVDALVGTPFVANDYYTKNQIDSFNFVNEYGLSQLVYGKDDVYTKNQIDNMGFLTSHQSLANYYDKDDIDGFSFITGSELSNLVYGKNDVYTKNQIDNMGFITSHQSLSNYYDKDDIDAFHFVTEGNLQNLVYTKNDVDGKIGNLGTVTETVDNEEITRNKTVKEYVDGKTPNMNNYYSKNDIDGFSFVTGSDLGTLVYGKSDVYTKTEIDNKVGNLGTVTETVDNEEVTRPKTIKEYVDGNTPNMSGYYTKTEIDNFNFVTGSNLYENVYSKTDSDNRYLREHQSLSNYYTKEEADAAIARMQASTGDNNGGFKIATNSSDNTKKGLYNSTANISTTAKNTIGDAAVIGGHSCVASGSSSHAEGNYATASGQYSHAEGNRTTASGGYSHAEGDWATASGFASHAEGHSTTASNYYSHAEGHSTTASGTYSHASGLNTVANHQSQTALGQYNVQEVNTSNGSISLSNNWDNGLDTLYGANKSIFVVGNGSSDNNRHNAFQVNRNGEILVADTKKIGKANGENATFSYNNVPMINLQDKLDMIVDASELGLDKLGIVGSYTGTTVYTGGYTAIASNNLPCLQVVINSRYEVSVGDKFIVSVGNYKGIFEITEKTEPQLSGNSTDYESDADNSTLFFRELRFNVYPVGSTFGEKTYINIYLNQFYIDEKEYLSVFKIDDENGTETLNIGIQDIIYTYTKQDILNKTYANWDELNSKEISYISNKPFGEFKGNYADVPTIYYSNIMFSNNELTDDGHKITSAFSTGIQYTIGNIKSFLVFVDDVLEGEYKLENLTNGYGTDAVEIKPYYSAVWGNKSTKHHFAFLCHYKYDENSYRMQDFIMKYIDIDDEYKNVDTSSTYPLAGKSIKILLLTGAEVASYTKTLDSKYVDYNSYVTDGTISNKPFGDINVETEVINGDILTNNQGESPFIAYFNQNGPNHGGFGMTLYLNGSSVTFVEGDVLTLFIDGVNMGTSEGFATASNGMFECGVGAKDSAGFRNKWMLYQNNGSHVLCVYGLTSGSHEIRIIKGTVGTSITTTTKKLDAKYVDTSALEATIASLTSQVSTLQSQIAVIQSQLAQQAQPVE